MPCRRNTSFFIRGDKLRCQRENRVQMKLECKEFQIIKGTVYQSNNEPCKGAVVQVIQRNCRNNLVEVIGYVFTGEDGEYLFSIKAKPYMLYELIVYEPLER